MKYLELDCFKNSQNCELISEQKKIEIENDGDREYLLSINNQSLQNCQLSMEIKNENPSSKEIDLKVFTEKDFLFQGNLARISSQTTSLKEISSESTKDYQLSFSFRETDNLSLNFDLNFIFDCQDLLPETIISNSLKSSKSSDSPTGQVLGKNQTIQPENLPGEKTNKPILKRTFPYLILLAALIFVIIFLANGKKKQEKNFQDKKKKSKEKTKFLG